jgi:hypothetical protein
MTTTEREPILASWKISEVLKEHPELLDVLVGLTPAFSKLRNPVLRRVQTRLVTVQQAARIAGLEPGYLVRTLNQAVGITPPDVDHVPETGTPDAGPPPWVATAPVVRELDVREMLDKGQEPFRLITGTAREVGAGEAFALVTGFEPLPPLRCPCKAGLQPLGPTHRRRRLACALPPRPRNRHERHASTRQHGLGRAGDGGSHHRRS